MLERGKPLLFSLLLPTLLLLLPFCSSSSEEEDEHEFDYLEGSGRGPKDWGKINPQWEACDHGKMQSPIDLYKRMEVLPNLGRLKRKYKPAQAFVKNRGHDIMLRWKAPAGSININGTEFNLKQCHWHSPSEHTFNGSRYQLELHLVHESNAGQVAVVGITYKYGKHEQLLSKLIPHIRLNKTAEADVGIIDPREIKNGSKKYFRYLGSLTVPPCKEGVIWTIIKKVRTVSRDQVRKLREAVNDGCKRNARPIQPNDGRTIWLYSPTQTTKSA